MLRVTAPLDYGQAVLVPLAAEFRRRHPDCRVVLDLRDEIVDLQSGDWDLSVRLGWLSDSSLKSRRVGSFAQYLVVARELMEGRAVPQDPADLGGVPLVANAALADPASWTFTDAAGRAQRVRMEPVASMTTTPAAPRWALTPSDPMGTTVRRIDPGQGGHRIVIRAAAEFRPSMETTAAQMARAARIMQRKFDDRFPMLAGTRMAHRWAGHLCLSMNHVSVCRELEPGLYSACVQNGLGTVRGTLTGIAAAEMAMGVTGGIAPGFAAEPLPTRLPGQPLRAGAGDTGGLPRCSPSADRLACGAPGPWT